MQSLLCDPVLEKDNETFTQVMVLFLFMVFGLISIILVCLRIIHGSPCFNHDLIIHTVKLSFFQQ